MTDNQSLVSIIIPCYNQAAFLPEALESVLQQTYNAWEAIIINDGSPDNTMEIARRYEARDSRIRTIDIANGGVSAARNVGLRSARGKYVLPLDADDKIAPNYIEKAIGIFTGSDDVDVVYARWQLFGLTDNTPNLRWLGYRQLLIHNSIFYAAMFRREDALRIGGYDEDMSVGYEDWEFFIRLLDENSVVVQIPEVLFYYRIKKLSRNVIANENEAAINKYIFRKHIDKYFHHYGDPINLCREYCNYEGRIEFENVKSHMKHSDSRSEAWQIVNDYRKKKPGNARVAAMAFKFFWYKVLR